MRRIALALLILCTRFVPAAWSQKCPTTVDWNEFHGINMQRWNPCEAVLGVHNVGSLQLKWSYATGGYVTASPMVVNGVAYFGSADNKVYAVDANTGVLLWSYQTGNAVQSSLAVANSVVYAGSTDGNLYALDASTGALLWSYATGGAVGSPAVAYGLVFATIPGNYGGATLFALNASTGTLRWSYPSCDILDRSPAVLNGVVYLSECDGLALNAGNGTMLWDFEMEYGGGGFFQGPAVANGKVFVTQKYARFFALDASTGGELWAWYTGINSNITGVPAVANGVVYIGLSGSYKRQSIGNVQALNASTGALLWQDIAGADVNGSPAVANGVVYVGAAVGTGTVYALNAKNGKPLWTAPGHSDSSPTVVNGMVYFSSGDNSVDAYGLP